MLKFAFKMHKKGLVMGKKVTFASDNSTSVQASSLSCSERIKNFFHRNEKTFVITSLVLVILIAVVAMGLVVAAGTAVSPVLLAIGVILLLISFVIMSVAAIKLAMTKLEPQKSEGELVVSKEGKAPLISISLRSEGDGDK